MKRILNEIGYRLMVGFFLILGILPDPLLYGIFGWLIYFILYKMVGYRVSVVRTNLANSFPGKSLGELKSIEKKFYRHLSEVFIDTIRLASIRESKIRKRMSYVNNAEIENGTEGRDWLSAMSHFGSWELTVGYSTFTSHSVFAVYRPLHSAVVDRYYRWARGRFGTEPVAMNDIFRRMVDARRPGHGNFTVAMIADQTPPKHEIKHWYRFLNQDTAFFSGTEKVAVKLKMPVYFLYIRQKRRRYYEAEFQMIYDGQEVLSDFELTERYVRKLEDMIKETPHLWMWSHRRWKHHPETQP